MIGESDLDHARDVTLLQKARIAELEAVYKASEAELGAAKRRIEELESRLAEYEHIADAILMLHKAYAMPSILDQVDQLRALREGE